MTWRCTTAGTARRCDSGQAAVELALCMPLVCLLLLGVVQIAVVVREQLVVQLAAREGARAAAVSAEPAAAATAAATASGIDPARADVVIDLNDATVQVHVASVVITDVPLVGALLPDVRVAAAVTMQREPP